MEEMQDASCSDDKTPAPKSVQFGTNSVVRQRRNYICDSPNTFPSIQTYKHREDVVDVQQHQWRCKSFGDNEQNNDNRMGSEKAPKLPVYIELGLLCANILLKYAHSPDVL